MALLYTSLRTVDVKIKKKHRAIDIDRWRFESKVQRGGTGYKFRCGLHIEGK